MKPWIKFAKILGSVSKCLDNKKWSWTKNNNCKYIEVRIDMRTGDCLLKDRHDNLITTEELEKQ